MSTVVFNSVGKVYGGDTRALADFDLQIADGELMVFVGPSGCGKTTALRMVAGLEEVTDGEITIDGRVVNDLEPRERDIAMVFQNYALYPQMTVFDNIAFGLRTRRTPKEETRRRVEEVSRSLELTDLLTRKPKQLSGGQRQRVAMGRAIVREPKVFLMDEPLSNLDARLRLDMRAEITRIQRQFDTTTIYVTHDQVEAMTMGDRVCVLSKGKLQQVGAPQDLYDRPGNLFVAGFLGSPPMNLFEAWIERDGDGLLARAGANSLALPAAPASLGSYVGERVALGVRPESAGHGEAQLSGTVRLSEVLGAERLMHLELDTRAVRHSDVLEQAEVKLGEPSPSASCPFVGRVAPHFAGEIGERVSIPVDSSRTHFFDLRSGEAIR